MSNPADAGSSLQFTNTLLGFNFTLLPLGSALNWKLLERKNSPQDLGMQNEGLFVGSTYNSSLSPEFEP